MISDKTQRKLDRAAKGLPDENLTEDDRLLQEEADALGLTLEDIKTLDDMDDDSGEPTMSDFNNARYEDQREAERTDGIH